MIEAELFDGTVLEFPEGTDPAVIQRTVKQVTAQRKAGAQGQPNRAQPAPAATQPQAPSAALAASQPYSATRANMDVGNGQLVTAGPGPTGSIDPALYEMGAIGRRFQPGTPQGMTTNPRTGTEMPEVVRAADGTEFYLDPATGGYIDRTGMKMREDQQTSRLKALGAGYVRGYSVNAADEAAGAIGGDRMREQTRAMQDANQEAYPFTTIAGEIVGAVANPIMRAIPAARSVMGAVGIGGATGAVDAFNRGEGGFENRVGDAAAGGAGAALFTLPLAMVGRGISKGYDAFARSAAERPSVNAFKAAKNAAYRAVDASGETFTGDDMAGLASRAKEILAAADFDDIADPQTAAALRTLEARAGQEVSLGRLDRLRQTLWDRYNRGEEPLILDMIGEIDDLINTRADASDAMRAARDANSTFRRVEMLEHVFRKAELQTEGTGSGGNILNKYRQAVTAILVDPKKAKWFSPEQVATMEAFVRGGQSENALRRIGKMAPSGNGLMTFLNVYASTIDPTFLAATVASQAAKTSADNMAVAGREGVLDAAAGFARPAPTGPGLTPLAVGSGVSADNAWRER